MNRRGILIVGALPLLTMTLLALMLVGASAQADRARLAERSLPAADPLQELSRPLSYVPALARDAAAAQAAEPDTHLPGSVTYHRDYAEPKTFATLRDLPNQADFDDLVRQRFRGAIAPQNVNPSSLAASANALILPWYE